MEETVIIIVSAIISLVIFYFIIKSAVSNGINESQLWRHDLIMLKMKLDGDKLADKTIRELHKTYWEYDKSFKQSESD